MHYNGQRKLKLMVLQGPVTNEQLKSSSFPLSRLIDNKSSFPEIHQTGESDSITGRTRIGSPLQKTFPYSNNQSNHHLEFAVADALNFPERGAELVVVSHHETPLNKVIRVEYYSSTPEETIEYFI